MFRHATHTFAPVHIGCAREARLLGCRIVPAPTSRGLLKIARRLVDIYRRDDRAGDAAPPPQATPDDAFMDALRAADRSLIPNLARFAFGRRG